MTAEELTFWIQAAAVVVAVGASIVALVISDLDRRNARRIAAKDRAVSVRQAKLMFELEVLTRLSQNLRRGGHTDSDIRQDMGAEAGALIGAIGAERLPRNWAKRIAKSHSGLREFIEDENNLEWIRNSVEAQVALSEVSEELGRLIAEQDVGY